MVKDQVAAHYLADALCEALFRQPGPTRLATLLRALPPGAQAGLALAGELLAADTRFAQCVTRWDLAHRLETGTRPLGGALDAILQTYGRPMPRPMLTAEICLARPGSPPQINDFLDRLISGSRDFGVVDEAIYLTKWLANLRAPDNTGLLFINGLSQDTEFQALQPRLTATGIKQRAVLDTAAAALKAAKVPLGNRALGLILHHHHGARFEPAEVLAAMCGDERFLSLSGPTWLLCEQEKAITRALARAYGQEEEFEPPAVDLLTVLHAEAPKLKLKLDAGLAEQVRELAQCARTPLDVEELLTEVMGLRPRQKQFNAAAQALDGLLAGDMALVRVGHGRYLSRTATPQWVKTVPETLLPEQLPLMAGNEATVLPLEQLAEGLAQHVTDPMYEDQGEAEVAVRDGVVDETKLALAIHHHECGTLKLRLMDQRLFNVPGPLAVATFIMPDGIELPIWINTETRLLYGFLTWFQANLPPQGALLTIQRVDDRIETYRLINEGGTDAATHVGRERLAQLQALGERLRRKRVSVTDMVAGVLHGAPKALAFDQLWAQMSVLRRLTRLQVASALTTGQFGHDGGRWRPGQ